MVEKSTIAVILFGLVIALSFKDLMVNSAMNEDEVEERENKLKNDMEINLQAGDKFDADGDLFEEDGDKKNNFDNNDMTDFEVNDDEDYLHEKSSETGSIPSTSSYSMKKKILSLKMNSNVQILKFKYCYSCGYRNMFEQYSQLIGQKYPDIKIVGENYSPAAWKLGVAQFMSTFKILVIGLIVFAHNPFQYVNMATPQVFTWATENKMYASLMIFFLSNAIETQMITTGAFEIHLNDIQIWSKLQSDRMPHEKELLQMLDMNFNFEAGKTENDGNFRI